jgi:gliding motility-associated-like protein
VQPYNTNNKNKPLMSAKPLYKKAALTAILYLISLLTTAQMVVKFGATPLSGCAPLVVNFRDSTTGGATQWKWDLGNGTISFLQHPSGTYFNPGTYTVKLVVTNAAGVKDSLIKTQYITVNALPIVNFTATPVTGCFPLPVCFTDNSTAGSGTVTDWLWDFGDGFTSTAQNPCHTYTAAGNYNVSLKVTNSLGCIKTLTKANNINISSGVHAAFTNSNPSGCSTPANINFQNQSTGTGVLSYEWNFGDGGTSTLQAPSHSYNNAGTYTVQLIVTNSTGCKDTATHVNSIVIGTVGANFIFPTTICAGTAFSFTNTSLPTPVSALWTFGDATSSTNINPVKSYANAGTFTVKLVSNFGACLDSITHDITVLPKPTSSFTSNPIAACAAPLTVNFTNTSTGAVSYQWLFGDGNTSTNANPSNTYTANGTYSVTLITTNASGCTDTLKKIDYINVLPPTGTINNLPQQGCAPLPWTFSSTVSSVDPIVSYQWNFGAAGTSTLQNPSIVFPAGIYDIQLVITTAGGCTDTIRVPQGIKSTVKPIANFTATPRDVCAFLPVNFQDLSTGTVTDWHWEFGDGSTSTLQNPIHSYNDTGNFTITLIVSNNGCADTISLINYVHVKPPIARFSMPINCTNRYTKTFVDNSIGADTWDWDFGDGTLHSNLQNPSHTYASVGTYTVSLTVYNNITGCDYTFSQSLIVADEVAAFSASLTELCKNSSTVFTATSVHSQPDIVSYEWNFGDGITGTGNNISHTYLLAGNYDVKLIITDVNGCKDSLTRIQYIHVFGPTANFTPSVSGSCLLTNINFTDQSTTDGIHPITEWQWNYGDGITEILTTPPFSHSYASAGIYSVILTVKDSYGCSVSITKNDLLTISIPVASFVTIDTASCPSKPLYFTNNSTGPSLTYLWDFGDNTTSTLFSPVHSYLLDGDYTIKLTVTDIYGCTNTFIRPDYIRIRSPFANFTVSDSVGTCPPLIVQFTNTSQFMDTWTWDFGDGNTSTALSPSHFYNVPGIYTAKLSITSPGTCTSVKTKIITVRGPQGSFTYSPISGCSPLNVNFIGTSIDNVSFIWDFNDGNTTATPDSILSHIYTIPGIYLPKMILKDAGGCTVPILGIDTIKVNGVLASFTQDTLIRCNSGNVAFTNTSISNDVITGYLWNFGDGNTSTNASPTHFYPTTGLYFPTLTVNTLSGCTNQITSPLPIRVVKTPDISLTQSANKCVPATMNFNGNLLNGDTSVINWQWSFSNGATASGQNINSIVFPNAGLYTATLIAINSSGCRDTTDSPLEVYGKPTINAGNDITICQATGQSLTATGGLSYTWSPSAGLNTATGATVIATPDSLTNYTVTGTSSFGCTNTDTVQVVVKYPFQIPNGTNAALCVGKSAVLSTSGNYSFSWSPSQGLNTTTGATVTATPNATTSYMVVAKDNNNCFTDTAHFLVKVYPIPTVNAGADKTINVGQSVTLTPTVSADVNSVIWSPSTYVVSSSSPSITVKPSLDIQYKVSVSNAGGCTASSQVNVFVLCDGANVYIPNTFSPNGDGANDYFFPRGTGLFTIKQLRIFNRWGEQVFEKYSFKANDESAGWNGTYKGQKLPTEVYVYIMDIQCENNTVLTYKGNIALIK